jgi:transcriptional regulator with XRE-family HTH domain
MPVNTKNHRLTPGDLRAYLGRHGITRTQIARRRGVSHQAVSAALFADLHERPVSPALLQEILNLANDILLERELEGDR